ncbi:MAG: putative DNA binding domain-containing protein [Roseburia sp.]|nr:putative DNA binding domain-containing protein [Roseburia sp.]
MNMQELKQLIYKGEKVDVECKKAESNVPKSVYESYSAFANTKGGYIILGVDENKKKNKPQERFIIQGVENPFKQLEDLWNTINSDKVNINILKDEDIFLVTEDAITLIVIHVLRADFQTRPIYVGTNPFTGAFKRNHEGDYHCTNAEIRAMFRDQNAEGVDDMVIEHYTMDDVDSDTLRAYRMRFQNENGDHVWNTYDDKHFLEMLGGYRKDRNKGIEGLTLAGLMMFGNGLVVRDVFDNIFMDYRDESHKSDDVRWNDRITYDGTWENNVFNFLGKILPKLTSELPKPFKLKGYVREDDTPLHKAIRESCVNMIIHADYMLEGTLKVIKTADGFEITNPGVLKIPQEQIFKGGNSKARNPRMQSMLRMVGYGDNVGSGFPTILNAWEEQGWETPKLIEDTVLNQVTLILKMKQEKAAKKSGEKKAAKKSGEKKVTKKTLENQMMILDSMQGDVWYKASDFEKIVPVRASRIKELLKDLTEQGKIQSTGSTKGKMYRKS